MDLATRLRTLRERADIGQAEIAAALEVSVSTVSEWESGKKRPRGRRLPEVAKFYNVSVDYLLNSGLAQQEGLAQTEEELLLLKRFREKNKKTQKAVLDILEPDADV